MACYARKDIHAQSTGDPAIIALSRSLKGPTEIHSLAALYGPTACLDPCRVSAARMSINCQFKFSRSVLAALIIVGFL